MLFDENVENVCLTRNTNALSLLLQNCPVIISIQLLFLIIQKFSEKHGGGKTVAVAFEKNLLNPNGRYTVILHRYV